MPLVPENGSNSPYSAMRGRDGSVSPNLLRMISELRYARWFIGICDSRICTIGPSRLAPRDKHGNSAGECTLLIRIPAVDITCASVLAIACSWVSDVHTFASLHLQGPLPLIILHNRPVLLQYTGFNAQHHMLLAADQGFRYNNWFRIFQ